MELLYNKIFNAKTTNLISFHVFFYVPDFFSLKKKNIKRLSILCSFCCQEGYLEVEHKEVLYYGRKCLEIRVNA